jgi:hypothetical protein
MRTEQGIATSTLPACMDAERAAKFFGWPTYFITLLMRSGHLKPLGKPSQNSRKWFAAVDLEALGRDPVWLDKAIKIVEKQVHESNKKQRSKGIVLAPPVLNQEAA